VINMIILKLCRVDLHIAYTDNAVWSASLITENIIPCKSFIRESFDMSLIKCFVF
jgi:hypothetical protein